MIQLIVAAIAPAKIYMLHHKEMQEQPNGRYIDLLIIISGKCGVPYTELTPVLKVVDFMRVPYYYKKGGLPLLQFLCFTMRRKRLIGSFCKN